MNEEDYLNDALQLLVRGIMLARKEIGENKIRLSVDLDGLLLTVAIGDWNEKEEKED